MRFVTFTKSGSVPRLGAEFGDQIIDLTALALKERIDLPDNLLALVRLGETGRQTVVAHLSKRPPQSLRPYLWPRGEVSLEAPFRPGKIIGVGLNYTQHVEESSRSLDTDRELPSRPVLFSKPGTAVIGPGSAIRHDSRLTAQLDWECELAVVIGRTARKVTEEEAWDHIFGYSIINDISARDQRRSGQWFFSKGQDSYAPFGPVVVTRDEIPAPLELDLSLRVNGEVKQDSSTRHMLFGIPRLIADITSGVTLEPGDVIATGSPDGVGAGFDPPQFLRPGDVVEATIESIGTLTNPVVDASGPVSAASAPAGAA
ncbi:fumarylacetoacetate hydrolase family protein [Streptomyces rhizosphaericus]|uniref:Fumarylacetoacetate hydrolase family protein n=1 Tax=Streptomyces rhizosphaericus TaxID=114699 RepID=A0A6G4AV46_9ACTN|nr:fumarylacetoacetate hydrolase family protein [Streptomyces rhizosphaericus]NEW76634.1 fumarylacetoacetate hydrolase family protein [Streptomyces rhizosphaericus]